MIEAVTIDQLRMLVAVAEKGSFTAGAKSVGRAQSAVSQAIATLEAQLGVALFDRSTRRPTLTRAGEALVGDARSVIDRVTALRTRARAIAGGAEARLTIAVSMLVPMSALVAVAREFDGMFPATELNLLVQEAAGPVDAVGRGIADIGVAGLFNIASRSDGTMEQRVIGSIGIDAVVAPGHPLAEVEGVLDAATLRLHRQLVSADAGGRGIAAPSGGPRWLIAGQDVRRAMALSGFGWAIMPRHVVEADIAAGRLTTLDLEALGGGDARERICALHQANFAPGPAGQWFLDALSARMEDGVPFVADLP